VSEQRRVEGLDVRAVVLVEGVSDQRALEALATMRGRDLAAEGIAVVPMGGATTIGRFLERFGPQGSDVRLAGMYDAGEEGAFRRGLERTGFGSHLTRADMETLGFFVCDADLEDELIRALGVDTVEQVVDAAGDLRSFRTFQKQPAQRGRAVERQLRRFMGTRSGRKIEYARLLVEALDPSRVPSPLDRALGHV
jgi:OLD-like protein